MNRIFSIENLEYVDRPLKYIQFYIEYLITGSGSLFKSISTLVNYLSHLCKKNKNGIDTI